MRGLPQVNHIIDGKNELVFKRGYVKCPQKPPSVVYMSFAEKSNDFQDIPIYRNTNFLILKMLCTIEYRQIIWIIFLPFFSDSLIFVYLTNKQPKLATLPNWHPLLKITFQPQMSVVHPPRSVIYNTQSRQPIILGTSTENKTFDDL